VKDPLVLAGSLGGIAAFLTAIVELVRRFALRRADRREAEARADGVTIDNLQKLQSVWGEQFASMNRDMDDLREDMRAAREAWETKRADLQDRIEQLEDVVARLRAQIRDELEGVPIA
jgi:chromosome segregation ATPase